MNILNMILIILNTIFDIIRVFMPMIIVLSLIIIANICYKVIKNKEYLNIKKVFDFKQKNDNKELLKRYNENLFLNMVREQKKYYQLKELNYIKSKFVIINKTGVKIYLITDYIGYIEGDIAKDFLLNNVDSKVKTIIPNIFKQAELDRIKLKEKLAEYIHSNIEIAIVINNNCYVRVDYPRTFKIVKMKDVYYYLDKEAKSGEKYTEDEIEQIAKML